MKEDIDPKVAEEIERVAKERAEKLANLKAENYHADKVRWEKLIERSNSRISEIEAGWCEHIHQLNDLPLKFEVSEYVDIICISCAELGKEVNIEWGEYIFAKNDLEYYTKLLKDNE